jgi:fused signal recognition particle receptor
LVVDATQGQNALEQARQFNEALGLTGVILTKLDSSAKGGMAVAITDGLKVPISYVGVGEKLEDLQPFDPREFVDALLA